MNQIKHIVARLDRHDRRALRCVCSLGKLGRDDLMRRLPDQYAMTRRLWSFGLITAQDLPRSWVEADRVRAEWTIQPTFFGRQVNSALSRIQEAA